MRTIHCVFFCLAALKCFDLSLVFCKMMFSTAWTASFVTWHRWHLGKSVRIDSPSGTSTSWMTERALRDSARINESCCCRALSKKETSQNCHLLFLITTRLLTWSWEEKREERTAHTVQLCCLGALKIWLAAVTQNRTLDLFFNLFWNKQYVVAIKKYIPLK